MTIQRDEVDDKAKGQTLLPLKFGEIKTKSSNKLPPESCDDKSRTIINEKTIQEVKKLTQNVRYRKFRSQENA